MGCDGYITDANSEVEVTVRCYGCGKDLRVGGPAWARGHKGTCPYRDRDANVPVVIEITNYRER